MQSFFALIFTALRLTHLLSRTLHPGGGHHPNTSTALARLGVDLLGARFGLLLLVHGLRPRGRELAQLVANHRLCHLDRREATALHGVETKKLRQTLSHHKVSAWDNPPSVVADHRLCHLDRRQATALHVNKGRVAHYALPSEEFVQCAVPSKDCMHGQIRQASDPPQGQPQEAISLGL